MDGQPQARIMGALSKAWDEDDPTLGDVFHRRRLIALSTRAIIFAGTPHRGSARAGLAAWGTSWLAAFGAETTAENVNDLQEGSNTTEMLREEFQKLRRRILASRVSMTPPRPDITIYTFCEGIPMPVVGIIVTRESAEIDGNNEIVSSISGRDHRTMVKFASRNENGYREYLGAIRDVIDEVRLEREAGVKYVTDEERLGREACMGTLTLRP
ncbi:alpha/beta-hydrolase [Penicillium malachiteum]|nr:alpha/beta-hydrolase [Penicillium malachiteum]